MERVEVGGRLPVPLRLHTQQFGVEAAPEGQVGVGAVLDDAAAVEHQDAIGQTRGAESVGDEQGGTAARDVLNRR